MISTDIIAQIRQEKQRITNNKQHPVAVKMSSSTWDSLVESDLANHFGDVEPHKCMVLEMMVIIDHALPDGVFRIYTDWTTAVVFPYA